LAGTCDSCLGGDSTTRIKLALPEQPEQYGGSGHVHQYRYRYLLGNHKSFPDRGLCRCLGVVPCVDSNQEHLSQVNKKRNVSL